MVENNMLKKSLGKYGFSKQSVTTVSPIIRAIEQNNVKDAEIEIAQLALKVCNEIENGILAPQTGDNYFTLIDLYLGDNFPELKLEKEIKDILFEGMILHDYGKDYGADLKIIRQLANQVLKRK